MKRKNTIISSYLSLLRKFLHSRFTHVRQNSPAHNRMDGKSEPTLEIRVPISPNQKDMRMLHYFLESLRNLEGPLVGRHDALLQ